MLIANNWDHDQHLHSLSHLWARPFAILACNFHSLEELKILRELRKFTEEYLLAEIWYNYITHFSMIKVISAPLPLELICNKQRWWYCFWYSIDNTIKLQRDTFAWFPQLAASSLMIISCAASSQQRSTVPQRVWWSLHFLHCACSIASAWNRHNVNTSAYDLFIRIWHTSPLPVLLLLLAFKCTIITSYKEHKEIIVFVYFDKFPLRL